jgi:uncharacterized paraquat-inducible protein A
MRAQGGDTPEVQGQHHPCPACGVMVTVPDREDPARGFTCPSCRAHLWERDGHLHLTWDHRDVTQGA